MTLQVSPRHRPRLLLVLLQRVHGSSPLVRRHELLRALSDVLLLLPQGHQVNICLQAAGDCCCQTESAEVCGHADHLPPAPPDGRGLLRQLHRLYIQKERLVS